MNGKKIRWGILGLGKIARKFAADLKRVADAELVAVGSRDIDKARAFAEEFGAKNAYGSYEDLVTDKEVDVIYIATPHSHHYENTLLCLEHNKHVLCEKAFAVNARQAEEMARVAKQKNLFLMEALWAKFLPQYNRLQEVLQRKRLGDIKSVIIDFGFIPSEPVPPRLFDPALAGGTLLDIGIYNVFFAMSILGKPDEIKAEMSPASTGIDEQCAILFKYKNGAMAQMFSSFATALPTEAYISGTKGRIKLTHRFYTPEASIQFYEGNPDSWETIFSGNSGQGFGYQHEAQHVVECLQKGLTESPVITLNETIERMWILDEIRQKAGIIYSAD